MAEKKNLLAVEQAAAQELDSYSISSEKAFKKAKKENLRVVLPEKNQLFIDIDDKITMEQYYESKEILEQFATIEKEEITPSKSGDPDRVHIVLTIRDFEITNPMERIALQAVLGSDLKREILSIMRVWNGDEFPTLFLEKKKEG